jgi:hypothetical protein
MIPKGFLGLGEDGVPWDGLHDLEDEFFEAPVSSGLVLPIDEEEVFLFEDGLVLPGFYLDDHGGVDVLDGRVVHLLLQLEVFLGNALHLLEEGLLPLELTPQFEIVAPLHPISMQMQYITISTHYSIL